jgi:hypothetical protein
MKRSGDLTSERNTNYSDEEIKKIEEYQHYANLKLSDISNDLPIEFMKVLKRHTLYFLNKNPYTKNKLLVFGDSSSLFYKDTLSLYFKEIIIYRDHWFFNKELIKWFEPDVIMEIRTERFLDLPYFENVNPSLNYELIDKCVLLNQRENQLIHAQNKINNQTNLLNEYKTQLKHTKNKINNQTNLLNEYKTQLDTYKGRKSVKFANKLINIKKKLSKFNNKD